MTDTKHLKLRGGKYSVQLAVPRRLQPLYGGRQVIVKALGTSDLRTAQRLRHAVLAELQAEFAQVELKASLQPTVAERLIEAGKRAYESIEAGEDEQHAHTVLELEVEAIAGVDLQRPLDKHSHVIYPDMPADTERVIHLALKVAETGHIDSLAHAVTDYLEQKKTDVVPSVLAETRRLLELLVKHTGPVEATALTRKVTGRFLGTLKGTKASSTLERYFAIYHAFGRWLKRRGDVASNPFEDQRDLLVVKQRRGVEATRESKRPYTLEEIATVVQGLPAGDDPLRALVMLALYSGARAEELCQLTHRSILDHDGCLWLDIKAGKTESAIRQIPVHTAIRPLVHGLAAAAQQRPGDPFLITGQSESGKDKRRSTIILVRYGYWVHKKLGLPSSVDFHSLRRSWHQRALSAEVIQPIQDLITGHRDPSLAMLYAQFADSATLRRAIDRIEYPGLSVSGPSTGAQQSPPDAA
jgi:integrase